MTTSPNMSGLSAPSALPNSLRTLTVRVIASTVGAMNGKHNTPNYEQDVFSQNDYSTSIGPDGKQQPELLAPRTDRPYMVSETVGTLSGPARYFRRTDPQSPWNRERLYP